ncbi:hypothetical protein Sango_2969100 [Sesamum angolense]|uniref:Reverse transcriptase Ty1/copia-type domain-containing protein n=1 Tax=Sesamum angolense TaxID=2727404 RepID=A0AAE1VTI0_9LAMI|nr:hypothetical protein Sango_2969100 [Sesamum angolense]
MDQEEGFTSIGEEQKICHLERTIYGLKKLFEVRTHVLMKLYGIMISSRMNLILVYTKRLVGARLRTLCYVDDILLIENDFKMLGDTKAWLSIQFFMKNMVLKRFKIENSKRGFLLIRHGIKLSKKQSPKIDEELKRMSEIRYASVIRSIQYVVQCTRPDTAYTLSVTSRYQACVGRRIGVRSRPYSST